MLRGRGGCGVELPCQPGTEQRSGGRQAEGAGEDAWAEVMAGEQACGRVDAVDNGRCFKPAPRGRVAVEGDLEP